MVPSHNRRDSEDIELGERENDAFLPSSATTSNSGVSDTKAKGKYDFLTRYIPTRVLDFCVNLSKIKIMLSLLAIFIILLVWNGFSKETIILVIVPSKSVELSHKVMKELAGSSIPSYVLEYAPLVHLDQKEIYFPSDLARHLKKTHPSQNFTALLPNSKYTLDNLSELNQLNDSEHVFLTAIKGEENGEEIKLRKFLHGQKPDEKTLQTHRAECAAVIVVEKGEGIVDAFYMYFYSFNAGPHALGHTVGNHVGDWEHNAIRFLNGKPQSIWYSQHNYGRAYTFSAVQKSANNRPIAYSARGSHANYADPDSHDLHDLNPGIPSHVAYDYTSQGPLWDPTLSAYFYAYSVATKEFDPQLKSKKTPVDWLKFEGRWGDAQFPMNRKGQEDFYGYKKWISGPQGPWFKALDRKEICLPLKDLKTHEDIPCKIEQKI